MNKKLLLVLAALLLLASLPKEDPGAFSQDSIEGTWIQVGGNQGSIGYTWDFRRGHLAICNQGKSTAKYRYKADTSRSSGSITLDDSYHGVYSVNGDVLKLAIVARNDAPPTDFTPKQGVEIYILKRKS